MSESIHFVDLLMRISTIPKFLPSLVMCVCLTCFVSCSGADEDAGHVNDPTLGGEANEIQDMSPGGVGEMDGVGGDPSKK